jgi:all-trans-retinol 13,14-reductase
MPAPSDKPYGLTSPEGPWDYLVIGSGMGGMTAAAMLAKLGKRVLVLEQHYIPGGYTHTFQRKGWTWDVGVHAVGEVGERSATGRLLRFLTGGRLEWASLGQVYDEFYYPDGVTVGFADSKTQFVANLKAAFPAEAADIDRYMVEVNAAAKAMKGFYTARALPGWLAGIVQRLMAPDAARVLATRTADVLAEVTANPRLRTVLAGQWGYYGVTPERSCFGVHALVTRHYFHGGYYPVGGSAKIADGLLQTVAEAGGWTRVKADVGRILIEGGRAVGVQLRDGETIRAGRVISAAGALNTIRHLLPKARVADRWAKSLDQLIPSPAYLCLNIGFKGDIRRAGAGAANKWFYETWDGEAATWAIDDPGGEAPVLYTSFPSLKDPEHDPGHEQRHTGEVVTFVPYEAFERWREARWMHRGPDYEALKADLTARMLKQLFRHMPGLESLVAYAELSTPLSAEHFVRATRGAIYGLEPTPERFANPWLRPASPVRDLYLAGSDMASGGVMGAFVGGLLAVVAAEPWATVALLRRFFRPGAAAAPANARKPLTRAGVASTMGASGRTDGAGR